MKNIFLSAVILTGLMAEAGQVYRQTSYDVETRDSGKTVGDIIKTASEKAAREKAARKRLGREILIPSIPVEVLNFQEDSLAGTKLNVLEAQCIEKHVNGAMALDVQTLANRMGVDRISILFGNRTDHRNPSDLEFGGITVTGQRVTEALHGEDWLTEDFSSLNSRVPDITPADWTLNSYRHLRDGTTLRTIHWREESAPPLKGIRLQYTVKDDKGIVVDKGSLGPFKDERPIRQAKSSLIGRHKSELKAPEGSLIVSTEVEDSTVISVNRLSERSRDEDVLKMTAVVVSIEGRGECFSQDPANDLRTELTTKLKILTGQTERTNYPETVAPRRRTATGGSRGSS